MFSRPGIPEKRNKTRLAEKFRCRAARINDHTAACAYQRHALPEDSKALLTASPAGIIFLRKYSIT
jgi:hypothetical protein